ncbi:uncharacterized protein LOC143281952 [Babylonia areolata]|uniref:uncharacterized protein LOC143281952 n=1 Tax=Babylonia areolata TaxID=304850 RepID=UPI003FD05F2E
MSDLSSSGSSGLTDWALVNSQGELEGSDADSNTSSIEVVGRDREVEEDVGQLDFASRESSPECIELEQLMKTTDTAARQGDFREKDGMAEEAQKQEGCRGRLSFQPPALTEDAHRTTASVRPQTVSETVGACSLEMVVDTTGKKAPKERTGGARCVRKPLLASPVSHESDSPPTSSTSDSVLSVSTVSSVSSTSRSSRDSDSESDFVRLEKDSSCLSTESEGEEAQALCRTSTMVTSGSSVGSGFNFLCGARVLQQPPSPPQQTPQPVLFSQSQSYSLPAQPPEEEAEMIPAQEVEMVALQGQEVIQGADDGILAPPHEELVHGLQQERPQAENVDLDQEEDMIPAEDDDESDEEEDVEEDEEPEELQLQPHQQPPRVAAIEAEAEDGVVPENEADGVDDDADTESSTEDGDQDDRIESEQSDDAHSAPPDDLDQVDLSVVNDIGDLPVVRGNVERHYIHCNNQQLNGRLNHVVLVVLVLALGMGLGHWIGCTREHFSQLEVQLSQMRRLHQVQDEYLQCLARNDELLVHSDVALQNERERHQEALTDLRDNNRELQEQLQDAQDRLEQLLTASARVPRASQQHPSPASLARDLQYALTLSKLLIASEDHFQLGLMSWGSESQQQLLEARETFSQAMEERQSKQRSQWEKRLQQEVSEGKHLNLGLQAARRRLNEQLTFLEAENADLRVTLGKLQHKTADASVKLPPPGKLVSDDPTASGYEKPPVVNVQQSASRDGLPSPPRPLPPPPLPAAGDVEEAMEPHEHKEGEPNRKGTWAAQTEPMEATRTLETDSDPVFQVSPDAGEQVETVHSTPELSDSAPVSGDEGGEAENTSKEEAGDMDRDKKRQYVQESTCRSGPRPIPVDVRLLQRNLTQERQRAEMWRHLYLWEREERRGLNATACLHYLMQGLNMSGLVQLVARFNWTGPGMDSVTDLTSLVSSMAQLHQHLLHSLPALWTDLSTNLHNLHSDLSQQDPPTARHQGGDDVAGKGWGEGKEGRAGAENPPPHSRWSDGMQTLLNKTRGTLSNVSRHIQQTWDQVKDVSRNLWPSNDSVLGRMAARVKDSVSSLSHKVHGKAVRWFKKRCRWGKHGLKKGSQEVFPEEENADKEDWQRRERSKERNGQQTAHEDGSGDRKKSPQNENSESGKNWNRFSQDSFEEDHYEEKNRNISSQQQEHSHRKKDEHLNKHHKRKSNGGEKQDKHIRKHSHEDTGHKDPEKEMSDKRYSNKSSGRNDKRHNHYKSHHGDPHGKRYHHHKRPDNKIKDRSYPHEDARKRSKETQGRGGNQNTDRHKETQFSTTAKHHSSHADRAADKARHKVQKQFHGLFTRVGAMSRRLFRSMDREDLVEVLEDVVKVLGVYSDSKHLDLPQSGHVWLQCQFHFWENAEHHHVIYSPEQQCFQFLAPWQLGLVAEFKEKMEKGECMKVQTVSCNDGVGPNEDEVNRYVCSDDNNPKDHDDDNEDDDHDHEEDDDHQKRKKQQARVFPKGQREGEHRYPGQAPHRPWNRDHTEESANKQVNHSEEESRAWYFHWVEGRNSLRSAEHKADWLFERASERDKTREQEHRGDWMFERASERDSRRGQDQIFERATNKNSNHDDEEGGRREEKHGHRHKDGHFHHHRRHRWHKDTEHQFERNEKQYRQKYGRTFF